jgi:hypothetical protein
MGMLGGIVGGAAGTLAMGVIQLALDKAKFDQDLSKVENQFEAATIRMGQNARKARDIGAIATGIGAGLIGGLAMVASEAEESRNLVKVTFGEMADDIQAWSEKSSASILNTEIAVQRQAGVLYNMAEAMGMSKDEAYKLSTGITEMAADFASFYNLEPDVAFDKMRAAISGEFEPMKQLGILLNETTIKTEALKQGTYDGTGVMDASAKAMATYALIMKGGQNAIGDAERTAGGFANQMRAIKATTLEGAAGIGSTLLPTLQSLAGVVLKLGEFMSNLSDDQKKFLGVALLTATGLAGVLAVGGQVTMWLSAYRLSLAATTLAQQATGAGATKMGLSMAGMGARGGPVLLSLAAVTAAVLAIANAWNRVYTERMQAQGTGMPGGGAGGRRMNTGGVLVGDENGNISKVPTASMDSTLNWWERMMIYFGDNSASDTMQGSMAATDAMQEVNEAKARELQLRIRERGSPDPNRTPRSDPSLGYYYSQGYSERAQATDLQEQVRGRTRI